MKKYFKRVIAFIAVMMSLFTLASCKNDGDLKMGKEALALKSQLDSLTYLNNGTVDACVIDSIMAGYYTNQSGDFDGLEIANIELLTEKFGIAAKKGSYTKIDKINEALYAIKDDKMQVIAHEFGIESEISLEGSYTPTTSSDDSWNKLASQGKAVIGFTYYAPIAYNNGGGLTGYDIELAREVFKWLNTKYMTSISVEFMEIEWSAKETLLANGTIDFVWNGLTITSEREANMCISEAYLNNRQVVVIDKKNHDKYQSIESLKDAVIAFEAGSAGDSIVRGDSKQKTWPTLFEGFGITLSIFAITLIFSLPLGLLLAFAVMSKLKPLKYVVKGFIWIIRGTPLMLQILLVTFIPLLFRISNKDITTALDIKTVQLLFIYAAIAFSINYSCYFSEIFRSGIESIPKGQFEACKVLGLNKAQTFFKVILPQVIKRIVPPMSNEIINLVKDTALASIIGVVDLLVAANHLVNNLAIYTPLIWAAMFYLVFNGLLTFVFGRIEKKLSYYEV